MDYKDVSSTVINKLHAISLRTWACCMLYDGCTGVQAAAAAHNGLIDFVHARFQAQHSPRLHVAFSNRAGLPYMFGGGRKWPSR
jgi:hypothetical protein